MAIKGLFFNAASETNIDRVYDTNDWADYFDGIVSDGVLMKDETSLKVANSSGMNVVVKKGAAYIDGRKLILDTDTIYPIQGSHATYARVDAVVMAKDMINRKMNIYVKTGTPSATPTYPAIVNSQNLVEYLIATVAVPAGATSLTSDNVVDMRGSDCGCVFGTEKMNKMYHERYETLGDSVGWYDNINVNKIVDAFFNNKKYQTYDFTNADANAQLTLNVVGEFNINENSQYDTSSYGFFGFTSPSGTMKRVILDFSNCVINFSFNNNVSVAYLFSLLSGGNANTVELHNVKINGVINTVGEGGTRIIDGFGVVKNTRMRIVNYDNEYVGGIRNVNIPDGLFENCYVEIINESKTSNGNNIYGYRMTDTVVEGASPQRIVNCTVRLTANADTYYTLHGFSGIGSYSNCYAYVYNVGDESLAYSVGYDNLATNSSYCSYTNCTASVTGKAEIIGFAGYGRYSNCHSHAASNTTIAKYCAAFAVFGEMTNCYAIARNAGNGSGYGIMTPVSQTSGSLKLVNCVAMGYCSTYHSGTSTVYAAGIAVNTASSTLQLICIGCQVPSRTWANFTQKESIRISGTTSGAAGALFGNIVYKAVTKHSGTNLTETATIVG